MKTLKIISLIFFVTLVFINTASAQVINIWEGTSGGGCNVPQYDAGGKLNNACNLCDALIVFRNIINFLFEVAIPLGVLMIVVGGIRIMTAGGNEENVKKGKKIFTSALIGLTIALSAWLIVNTILQFLAGDGNLVPWSSIDCS